jgi:hypothetical protein
MKVSKELQTSGKSGFQVRSRMRMIDASEGRTTGASERRLSDQLRRRIAAALAQVLVYHAPGGVFAASAAGSNRQFVLYIEE